MEKHFCVLYFLDKTTREFVVRSWDLNEVIKEIRTISHGKPYAFSFSTRFLAENPLDSYLVKRSGMYYINAQLLDWEDFQDQENPDQNIIKEMRVNQVNRMVRTLDGELHSFNDDDQLLNVSV